VVEAEENINTTHSNSPPLLAVMMRARVVRCASIQNNRTKQEL
jgi:hypothetical protein